MVCPKFDSHVSYILKLQWWCLSVTGLSVLHNPVTISMAELCGGAGGGRGGGRGRGEGGQGGIFFFCPKLPRTYYGFQDMVGRAREGILFFIFFRPKLPRTYYGFQDQNLKTFRT